MGLATFFVEFYTLLTKSRSFNFNFLINPSYQSLVFLKSKVSSQNLGLAEKSDILAKV